ncbi:MAG: ComF family protein [Candidatus Omnitrophica bacterium]|nr:ComF family protein [Candidatus Omnitrophota bacterium]
MLKGLIGGLKDILYPKSCLVCKKNIKSLPSVDEIVCTPCWGKIKINPPPFCHCCGRHLKITSSVKNMCPSCLKKKFNFNRAFSPCVYDGAIKELIHEFKYKNKDYLGRVLSKPMIDFIKEYNVPMEYLDLIVPVPLHETKLREREFNQAQVLSSHIAKEFNKEVSSNILKRIRNTKTQTELQTEERLLNVRGSFSLAQDRDIKGKNILLVDDVLTTGATCSEAAGVLKDAGAAIVFVLTLAN